MQPSVPALPYSLDALAPYISAETLEYHYGKHHHAYASKLNELITGSEFESRSLESIIRSSSGPVFNNAAQVWNHNFYWNSLKPHDGGTRDSALSDAIGMKWESYEKFKEKFTESCVANFGSCGTWLVKKQDGSLDIVNTSNAGCPLTGSGIPLLTCDVWEHAYYLDNRHQRPKYVEAFWNVVNWNFAARNFT